jgi:hypothetical protein
MGHRELMAQARFGLMKGSRHAKNRLTPLYRNDAARRETFAISDSVDVVEYGNRRVARTQKIAMKRVR